MNDANLYQVESVLLKRVVQLQKLLIVRIEKIAEYFKW